MTARQPARAAPSSAPPGAGATHGWPAPAACCSPCHRSHQRRPPGQWRGAMMAAAAAAPCRWPWWRLRPPPWHCAVPAQLRGSSSSGGASHLALHQPPPWSWHRPVSAPPCGEHRCHRRRRWMRPLPPRSRRVPCRGRCAPCRRAADGRTQLPSSPPRTRGPAPAGPGRAARVWCVSPRKQTGHIGEFQSNFGARPRRHIAMSTCLAEQQVQQVQLRRRQRLRDLPSDPHRIHRWSAADTTATAVPTAVPISRPPPAPAHPLQRRHAGELPLQAPEAQPLGLAAQDGGGDGGADIT